MILLIDNFDSFTHMLQDYLKQQGVEVITLRYSELYPEHEALSLAQGLVISPGPGNPADYPILFEVLAKYSGSKPMLGVCLGHQTLCTYFGATLKKATLPMHGKVSVITHSGTELYRGIDSPTEVTRYHSLIITDLPDRLEATAHTNTGELMSFRHRELPIWGVQYHPEAVLTKNGLKIIENFVSFVQELASNSVRTKGQEEALKGLPKNEICL